MEVRLTIAPPPAARSRGIACFEQRKMLLRLVARTSVPGDLGALVHGAVAEPPPADADAVEEDVDAFQAAEERLDVVGNRDVGLLAVERDDLGPGVGERRRDRPSDPAGGPGHDGNLSCQRPIRHAPILSRG